VTRRSAYMGAAAAISLAVAAFLVNRWRLLPEVAPDADGQNAPTPLAKAGERFQDSSAQSSQVRKLPGPKASAPLSRDDYLRILDRLRAAALAGDSSAIRSLMTQLSVSSPVVEGVLWEILRKPGPMDGAHFLLLVGGVLGRIGTMDTLERALAYAAELGPAGHFPGYDHEGNPSQARAILNALLSNLFRELLLRKDMGQEAQTRLLTWVKDASLDPSMRQVSIMTVLSTRGSQGSEAIIGMFETTDDHDLRLAIVSAMATTGSSDMVIPLVGWYEANPELRHRIAEALATHLSPDVALRILLDHAQEEVRAGDPSPAMAGVLWLGRREDAFALLLDSAKHAADPTVRRQCVDALGSSPSKLVVSCLVEVARTEVDGFVRAAAYGGIATRAETAFSAEFLARSYETDLEPTARQAIVLGLVNVLSKGGEPAAQAMTPILKDIQAAKGDRGSTLVQISVHAARAGGLIAEFATRLREVQTRVDNPSTRKAIMSALDSTGK
jgi:hypothetical protein